MLVSMFKKLKSTCCTLPLHACVTRYTTQARLAETARCAKNNMTSFWATKIVYYNWLSRFCGFIGISSDFIMHCYGHLIFEKHLWRSRVLPSRERVQVSRRSATGTFLYRHVQGNPHSGPRETFACGIRNPSLWNPEYSSSNPESH